MELLNIKQVSALTYGTTSVSTLRWWIANPNKDAGPKYGRLGCRIVYRRSDVEAWINAAFAE